MEKLNEDELVELNRRGYDLISQDFQATRQHIWPELEYLKNWVAPGERVLDLGCGHGRLINLFDGLKIDYHGLDHSGELIEAAKRRFPGHSFQVGDVRQLPYSDALFGSVWLIALLHHLPPSASAKAIKEACRVVRPSGKVIITVWQPHFSWLKNWRRHGRRSFFKKWGGQSWLYYYFFKPEELKKLVESLGLAILEEGFLVKGKRRNYFIIACRAPIA